MSTISPGTIVTINKHGNVAYVVVRQDTFNPKRWFCVAKVVGKIPYEKTGVLHSGLTAGEGDITVVQKAPTFVPGQQVRFNGSVAEVIEDLDDIVRLAVAPKRFKTRAGDHLHQPASQATAIKADLVIDALGE